MDESTEEVRFQIHRPTFRISPYHVNHESLRHASNCGRKLCLVYLGAESDTMRKKRKQRETDGVQTTLTPTIPFDLPHATALGAEGERSVEQESVAEMLDIEDHYGVTPSSRYIPPEEIDIEQLDTGSFWPEVTRAIEKSKERMVTSIANHIDKVHGRYLNDPYADITIEPRSQREELHPDLLGYEFDLMYPQGMVRSSAILFRGFIDFIAITSDTTIIPLEVKTTKIRSTYDTFQLQCYLNALKFGGDVKPQLPYDAHRVLLETKLHRLRKIKDTLIAEARVELENRIRLIFKRRSIDVSMFPWWVIEHRAKLTSMDLLSSIREKSRVYQVVSKEHDSIYPNFSSLTEIQKKKQNQLITSEALRSIDRGLLIYTRLGETHEVKVDASDFKPVVQTWIDAVLTSNKGRALPIPDNAPCSRCGYKQACSKYREHEYPEYIIKPVHVLYELVDTALTNSEVITARRFKRYTKPIRNPRMLETVQTRLLEFDTALDLTQTVVESFRPSQPIDGQMHYDLYELCRIASRISGEVLHLKTQYALENNDSTSQSLEQWGKTAVLKESKEYSRLRPSIIRGHAKDALAYWELS